jgi:hypothetical protein
MKNMETNKPYGYVIEETVKYKPGGFLKKEREYTDLYWNHKIYRTLEIAKEALNNIKRTSLLSSENFDLRYKIVPLYKKE